MTAPSPFWVPGRIEVLGKHTDYAGGRSLLCALERGFTLHATRRADNSVNVRDSALKEEFHTTLDATADAPRGSWGRYVATIARRIARDFPEARTGADIVLSSDLPACAGLGSSSALVVAIAMALIDANDLAASPRYIAAFHQTADLAGYLGAAENGLPFGAFASDAGVGTFGGSQDHTAILCCRAGELSQFSYAPVRHEADVALAREYTFAIGVSGVIASKTGAALSQYNRLSVAVSRLLELWNRTLGRTDRTLAEAMNTGPGAPDRLRLALRDAHVAEFSADDLQRRLDQFLEESNTIVPAATRALRTGAIGELGAIVDRSQHLAEVCLGNQVPETIALQRLAREAGAVAASAFGAGFGGSVWALVRAGDADEFVATWAKRYRAVDSYAAHESRFFTSRPGQAAHNRTERG